MLASLMRYRHTQRGRFHYLLWLGGAAGIAAAFVARDPLVAAAVGTAACLLVLTGFCFAQLSVEDEGARLSVRYGPIPLLGRSIRFADIRSVRRARSRWFDGFGIHWLPGRGWTWNLHGFDCVELELAGEKRLRIGSDDADALAEHLARRLAAG